MATDLRAQTSKELGRLLLTHASTGTVSTEKTKPGIQGASSILFDSDCCLNWFLWLCPLQTDGNMGRTAAVHKAPLNSTRLQLHPS